MPKAASHAFVDHTAEVELRLEAPSLDELFAEAGRATAELMLAEPGGEATVHERVALEAPDRAALLVAWVDELVYRAETRKAVFTRFAVRAGETRLEAELWGVPEPVIKTAIKAATYHALRLEPSGGGWEATVVLDV